MIRQFLMFLIGFRKNDLDLKHEHEALPINLGFNLPMEFYSLKFNSICEGSKSFSQVFFYQN